MNVSLRFGLGLTLSLVLVTTAGADNWPQWRGPTNDGICRETGIQLEWGKEKNVAWRVPLPGPSGATPVVWGDHIFLTSVDKDDLQLICVSTAGKELWKRTVCTGNKDARTGEGNSASPTPSTDGKYVWVFFGTGVLACYDFDGKEVWKFDVQDRYGAFDIQFGMTSTPILDGAHLYLQLIHGKWGGPYRVGKVVKLEKTTGKEVWAVERTTDADDECKHAYCSPWMYHDGNTQFLVSHGANCTVAHDLQTGKEIWRLSGLNGPSRFSPRYDNTFRMVASPGCAPGTIIVPTCKNGQVVAVKIGPETKGELSGSEKLVPWTYPKTPDVSCPLIVDGLVYLLQSDGQICCLDQETGTELYRKRTHDGQHRASPVLVDGHILLTARDGHVSVIKHGREFNLVRGNELGEPQTASPVIANGTLYLRTYAALYAIR